MLPLAFQMPEIPGPLVAMIFIIFLQWIIRKIRGPQEEPLIDAGEVEELQREETEGQRRLREAREEAQRRLHEAQEEARRRFREQMQGGPIAPAAPSHPAGPVSSRGRVPVSAPTPPPLPRVEAAVVRPVLSAAEQKALEVLQQRDHQVWAIHGEARYRKSSFRSLLSDPSSLRKAVVLKEVLEKPVALREME